MFHDILKDKRQGELTFAINALVREDIFTENFDLLEYAFNGKDVGSNEFRDMTEMNIIPYLSRFIKLKKHSSLT